MTNISRVITVWALLISMVYTFPSEPTKIAESNSPFATFYTNGQKIVRSSDDKLLVVFQDLENDEPVVKYAISEDHIKWSMPQTFGLGIMPALCIDESDRVYAVWMKADSSALSLWEYEWSTWYEVMTIQVDSIETYHHPSIEYQNDSVHIVWQGRLKGNTVDGIYYTRLIPFADTLATILKLNSSDLIPEKPLIRGEITFSRYPNPYYPLIIFWVEFTEDRSTSQIMYTIIYYEQDLFEMNLSPAKCIENSNGKRYPTISLDYGMFFLAFADTSGSCITFCTGVIEGDGLRFWDGCGEIFTAQNPMPMLDNPILYFECALLWQDQNEIHYSQLTFQDDPIPKFGCLPETPVQVSQPNDYQKMNPNVCYRTFRNNFFDVIWTEEADNVYRVMHRRVDKIHNGDGILESVNAPVAEYELYQNYPNPFNASTTLSYRTPHAGRIKLAIYNTKGQEVTVLVNGFQTVGNYQVVWQTADLPSGVYFYKLVTAEGILTKKLLLLK